MATDRVRPVASSAATRATMRANRRRDTGPELRLRSALHLRGWRFRIDLPVGTGDRRVAVFVDGCFWHSCPEHGERPRANASFWDAKFRRTVERDLGDTESLERSGWIVVRVWEHEMVAEAVAAVEVALRASRESAITGGRREQIGASGR